ncbi:NERD domain-containing protein [Luteococcus sp. H138]|uniref:nuclease-related domain-containing DEAD/DEAH box helicase n=1 Tax=unclassified Luteococcus TaxID=2639923 RepID=UPI00313ECD27
MTARTQPGHVSFTTTSEHQVHDRVVRQFDDDCLVLANLRVSDQTKDHEIDLLVLMPGSGIVTVEVKGSHVWHDGADWRINRGAGDEVIHPVDQARDACYALRSFVESDPRWGSRRRVRWSHHVVLARTELPADFATPDCPRWQVSGLGDLGTLGDRIWETTWRYRRDALAPSRDDVDTIERILLGRALPAVDASQLAADREERSRRLTMEQANLLRVTRLLNRVEVRGGAGSGKTMLAVQQAGDLASGRLTGQRQRVAVVCYSYGLANFLRRELCVGSHGKRPAFVGTFEQLGRLWGLEMASRDDSDFWEQRLPELMAERAGELGDEQRFDAIIVDEAQDFAETWWAPLLASLRDEENGGLFVYSDERQRVFPRFGRPPVALVPLVLDHNLRNTRQIAETFAPLAPPMNLRGDSGPEVSFVPCTLDGAIEAADEQIDALFDEGWCEHDIALITMGRRHPVQIERQQVLGYDGYWDEFWNGTDIFYSHVLGFKGLERRAVVLCVNLDAGRERAAEMLYVGLSRATDRLIVVGDPAEVRAMGGDEVARRLGI